METIESFKENGKWTAAVKHGNLVVHVCVRKTKAEAIHAVKNREEAHV